MLPGDVMQNAVAKRVTMTFLLFLISGFVHQFTTWQLDSGCRDYADIQFFCLNAVAVILESVLLEHILSCSASQDGKHAVKSKSQALGYVRVAILRLVGYMWVASFFVCAIPKIYYPRVYCLIIQQAGTR